MINPIAFQLGPISVHWYGILYGVGLFVGLWMLTQLNQKRPVFKNNDSWFDLLFWVFLLGVILGGRLGYVLFYNLPFYLEPLAKIFAVWQGGMSFHGRLLGTALVTYLYAKKRRVRFVDVADLLVIPRGAGPKPGPIGEFY
ncbi:prolipoprotein diacylglyceryl transferase [Candidatus Peregrinibacteria bacterium]|nr:MAG: prolipoprotein diacylglyceryl transferase [Candidatus Peregrinibacteria bacterium]